MLPVILIAPHACSAIQDNLKKRYALTDEQIWKCSDPFTDYLSEFTCVNDKHTANVNRLVCDLNRAPNTCDAFREFDFFGSKVFKDDQEFTAKEKENLLTQYWYPFHQAIADSIQTMDNAGAEVILLVDYHNTAGDHALNDNNDYMPSMILSNLGAEDACEDKEGLSIPYDYMFELSDFIEDQLGISADLNRIYKGGYNLYWYTHLRDILGIRAKIYAIQIEYNLDYVFDPATQTFDRGALENLQNCLNQGIEYMYNSILLKEKFDKIKPLC